MPPTSTPTARPGGSGFGGLLVNGDFEQTSGGKPVGWAKFGGEMSSSADAARGAYAACLESTTDSAKWLHQLVPIVGGNWYAASVSARVVGPAAAAVRISWYASADGSGASIEQHDSPETTSAAWHTLTTGPIQAPAAATSARFRLMLWPAGTAEACFDDASFAVAMAPAATPTPPAASIAPPSTIATRAVPTAGTTGGAAPAPPSPPAIISGQAPAGATTLRISEVLSDPAEPGRDAPYEWVELVNTGAAPVSLEGWSIEDTARRDLLPAVIVPPGGYVVLSGGSAALPPGVVAVPLPGGDIGNGLGNDGDLLRLVAPDGTVVDEMSYGDNTSVFDPAPAAPPPGRSLGLRDPWSDSGGDAWALTLSLTPGFANTFPTPAPSSPRSGAATGTPANDPSAAPHVDEPGDGGSIAPWVILGGLLGISAGMGGAALGPRIRRAMGGRRAR